MTRERTQGFGLILGGTLTIAVVLSVFASGPIASALVTDSDVARFEAVPSYINLNMTTVIEVEIGNSKGSGLDNYRVTVMDPSGGTTEAWYNFTGIGTLAIEYGNQSAGFNVLVEKVGNYDLILEHFDGVSFSPAGQAQFAATDELIIVTESATASNEFTDVHNCPLAQEFQRGGEIIARAYVTYASNGEYVNGTENPLAIGRINGTIFGDTKSLFWHNVYHFWRWAWFIPWDSADGPFYFTVDASDGKGNHGMGTSPMSPLLSWKVTPAILKVVAYVQNSTGDDSVLFHPGDTVTVKAHVTYEGHNAHNAVFPGPLNATRGGQVTAVIGYGDYDASTGEFENTLTTLTLTNPNPDSGDWVGTYVVKGSDANLPTLQVVFTASDGTSPANSGSAFGPNFAFEPVTESPPPSDDEESAPSGLDPLMVGIIAVIALIIGLGIGLLIMRGKSGPKMEEEVIEIETEE